MDTNSTGGWLKHVVFLCSILLGKPLGLTSTPGRHWWMSRVTLSVVSRQQRPTVTWVFVVKRLGRSSFFCGCPTIPKFVLCQPMSQPIYDGCFSGFLPGLIKLKSCCERTYSTSILGGAVPFTNWVISQFDPNLWRFLPWFISINDPTAPRLEDARKLQVRRGHSPAQPHGTPQVAVIGCVVNLFINHSNI